MNTTELETNGDGRMCGWLTIDTCPVETLVIVGGGNCPAVHINMLAATSSKSEPYVFAGLGEVQQPTHWMHIPDPPKQSNAGLGD